MNDKLRQQLKDFVTRNGVKLNHIALSMGIDASFLCHFLKCRVNMSLKNLEKLKAYLSKGIQYEE